MLLAASLRARAISGNFGNERGVVRAVSELNVTHFFSPGPARRAYYFAEATGLSHRHRHNIDRAHHVMP